MPTTTASVSIDRSERTTIAGKVKDQFMKIAKVKHPDVNFYKDITKRIYLESLEAIKDFTPEQLAYIPCVDRSNFSYYISTYSFAEPEIFFQHLRDEIRYNTDLLQTNVNLAELDPDDIALPPNMKILEDKNLMPMVFIKFIATVDVAHNKRIVSPSQTIKDEIVAFNQRMQDRYDELETQLKTLLSVVESCKSTKMFEAALPQMVNMYPISVKNKHRAKNDARHRELSQKEKLVQDATASLAAATLLGDVD